MSENIRSTNLRFNLEKDTQKRAWQYLQNMDKQQFEQFKADVENLDFLTFKSTAPFNKTERFKGVSPSP